jgi:hypothetical protein
MSIYQNLPSDNVEHHIVKPPMLVDEVSDTEYYIGTSRRFSEQTDKKWRIQRIWKVGSVWYFGYPDGDQSFNYIWASRYGYTYKQ